MEEGRGGGGGALRPAATGKTATTETIHIKAVGSSPVQRSLCTLQSAPSIAVPLQWRDQL